MKRIASILLLTIFLFNVGGYYLVFIGLHHRADLLLSERIERNQYNSEETIELKIPVSLPYPIQQNGFEKADGKFEHNGIFYKLVKQKFENDTVYIVCIRDVESKQIADTLKDYVAKTNELPLNSKSLNLLGKFLKDFESIAADLIEHSNGWNSKITFGEQTLLFSPVDITLLSPPPKA